MIRDFDYDYSYDVLDRLVAARPIGQITIIELYVHDASGRLVESHRGAMRHPGKNGQ